MSDAYIEEKLVAFVKEYAKLRAATDLELVERRGNLYEKIRLIGETAAFFGRYEAMQKLHDAAEQLVGNDNSVGYHLNYVWDGVGTWIC